jgi:hypothetical protein
LANSLTSIGSGAFNHCTKLTTIGLAHLAKLESINSYAFDGCVAITSIDLSPLTALTSIGECAFRGCAGLTTLKLPPAMFVEENSASIDNQAFRDCTNLNAIYLPEGVAESVGTNCNTNAFYNCPETGTIYYSGDSALADAFISKFIALAN